MGSVFVSHQGGGGVATSKDRKSGVWARLKSRLLSLGPSHHVQQPGPDAQPLKVVIDSDLNGVIYQDIGNNYSQNKYFPQTWQYKGITIAAVLATVSLTLTTIMWLTNIYGNAILKLVSIRNDIDTVFELWRVPPTKPTLSVYIFNYTNHKKVLQGKEKPHVTEVGPYVFREKMERINVQFNSNGTVSFQENRTIISDPDKSVYKDMNETVIVPNVPLIAIFKVFSSLFYADQTVFSGILHSANAQPFLNVTVHDFIWGYEDEFFKMLKTVIKLLSETDTKGFGFLNKRRGVHHDVVTMYTGETDLESIGEITRWNGNDRIGCWGNTNCDKISGSDGTIFPAKRAREGKPLYIYSHGMCRRLPIYFNKTTKSKDGFPVQEYNVDYNLFDFSNKTKENICYRYKNSYPPSGIFNTGPCQKDKPIYASFPHFWQGEEQLHQSIVGLHPDENKHKSYFQIHKKLGICLKAKTRFQLNIMLHKPRFVHQLSELQNETIILPIAWLDYDSGDLPPHFVNIVHHLTYTVTYIEETLKWVFLICTISSVVNLFVQVRLYVRNP